MPTLKLLLTAAPVHDLRRIASQLGVSGRALQRKTAFVDAIANGWADPAIRNRVLATLSPAARGALAHLLRVARSPAALFFAEYGDIRPARTHVSGHRPATVAEELYYAALLGPADLTSIRTATSLCAPDDLALDDMLPTVPLAAPFPADAAPFPTPPAWATAYDVAQWLLLLHEQTLTGASGMPRPGAIWPAPHYLHQLNRRLAAPAATPLPRAPSHNHRLRLILFLADAAGLQRNHTLTPSGWAWLEEPPEQQTAWLWRAWLDAAPTLRHRYAFADGLLPKPWPAPFIAALQAMPQRATATQLAEHLLTHPNLPAHYWVHLVASLHDLQQLVVRVVHQVALPLGILTSLRTRRGVTYRLTPLGAFLLGAVDAPAPAWQPATVAPPTLTTGAAAWTLALPPTLPVRIQADLAAFTTHTATIGAAPVIVQQYTLDDASLARAGANGFQWPALANALAHTGLSLSDQDWQQLAARTARLPHITLRTQTLLHTDRSADLRALLDQPALRPLLDNLLSATTATLAAPPDVVHSQLQAAGYVVQADLPAAPAAPLAPDAALWLAARFYRRLADFLPLPLPLPAAHLDHLLTGLSAREHSILTAAFARLEAAFLDLLDGRIFSPPAFLGDVERHRTQLETAAAHNQPRYLDYFSPGRNLLTRRPVTPLWLETHNDHLYLRAECLLSGRILLFRLDRIQAVWETPPTDVVADGE